MIFPFFTSAGLPFLASCLLRQLTSLPHHDGRWAPWTVNQTTLPLLNFLFLRCLVTAVRKAPNSVLKGFRWHRTARSLTSVWPGCQKLANTGMLEGDFCQCWDQSSEPGKVKVREVEALVLRRPTDVRICCNLHMKGPHPQRSCPKGFSFWLMILLRV